MILGSGEEESPSWELDQSRALFSPGQTPKPPPGPAGAGGVHPVGLSPAHGGRWLHLEFLLPTPSGALSTFPLFALSRQERLGSTKSSPRRSTPSSKLICGGEGCGQPQILSPSFSQPPPARSILLHPHLGCQDVWFACREGPGSGWGWEPLSCPTLCESDPICSGCLSAAACPSSWAFSLS